MGRHTAFLFMFLFTIMSLASCGGGSGTNTAGPEPQPEPEQQPEPQPNTEQELVLTGQTIQGEFFPDGELAHCVLETLYETSNTLEDILSLSCSNRNISDLSGLENLINLEYLGLSWNNLNSIDLSPFPNLRTLDLDFNALTSLDTSQNPNLRTLYAAGNQISNLDLTENSLLFALLVPDNPIASLNLSAQNVLRELNLTNTQVSALDLSANTSIQYVALSASNIVASSHADLGIDDDSVIIDILTAPNTNIDGTVFPDQNFAACVQYFSRDTSLESVRSLFCESKDINSIEGIGRLSGLITAGLWSNNISEADLSDNAFLTSLFLSFNQLTELTPPGNVLIENFSVRGNDLDDAQIAALRLLRGVYRNIDVAENYVLGEFFPDKRFAGCIANAVFNNGYTSLDEITNLDCSGIYIISTEGSDKLSNLESLTVD